MQNLLALIRRPELKDKLRDEFLVHGPNSDGLIGLGSTTSVLETAADGSADFGDLHAYLTYPSPNGFGRWRILLAGRAARDIDNLRRGGSGLYEIVIQKLRYVRASFLESVLPLMKAFSDRELSWGQFSPTNHKKITHNSPVPIFEVRLPSNPRLIVRNVLTAIMLVH